MSAPTIACRQVKIADTESWNAIEKAFSTADPVSFQQGWREDLQEGFRPAAVRTGWDDRHLLVYAELEDDDIFNPVTGYNEPAFQHGDVFEMFLRPVGQDAYFEIHVSPLNQKFQLRIPSAEIFKAPKLVPGIPPEWFIRDVEIESRVLVDLQCGCWRVLAMIPLNLVSENKRTAFGDEWCFSFCRYDYTRGGQAPVLSSTSPHKVINYHRQEEWGRIQFA